MDTAVRTTRLRRLCLVGALDRFCYNGIRALFVVYLT
jgi:dipeptide/tripeptide permease